MLITIDLRDTDHRDLIAAALSSAAAHRVTAARRAAGELDADPEVTDKRTGAVRIARTLAEADVLEQAAEQIRTAVEQPATPPAPEPRARRSRKKAARTAPEPPLPDEEGTPAGGPTAAQLAEARRIADAALADLAAKAPDDDPTITDDLTDADLDPLTDEDAADVAAAEAAIDLEADAP